MRWLADDDVRRLLPPPPEAVELVDAALRALARGEAQAPPKPSVSTVPGAFANAMPASWPERDLLGCKWISIFPGNAGRGLPTAGGLMVVNDGRTGVPSCLMPADRLTAARTAAVSGACVRALAPVGGSHVAFLGAGVQARSHLLVLEALGVDQVVVWARRREAREELAAWAAGHAPGVELRTVPEAADAVRGAAVVISGLPIGLSGLRLDPDSLRADALVLPLDYGTSVGADVAGTALLAADDVRQFEAVRGEGKLGSGYPSPSTWTGRLLDQGRGHASTGRVVCQNLGTGVTDLVVAGAVARRAEAEGAGQVLAGTAS